VQADEALERFRAEHGADALYNALMSGQYTQPDGLIYGGRQREWSNRTLEEIVETFLASAEKIAFIDWHTGIGEYGKPFFLCFNDPDSDLFDRAARWWGGDQIKRARPHGLSRPEYTGLVFHGMQQFLGNRPMCGAVIEIGTRGQKMRRILRLDLWLRFRAQRGSEVYDMLRADMDDAFCPFDQEWREGVIDHGLAITRQAVAGLGSW
jgi:Protein of unknown function (DUF2817)